MRNASLISTTPWVVLAFLIVGATEPWATPAEAQSQSPSYRLQPVTMDAGGARGVGATALADGSLGQALVVGASSAPHFIVQSGFWGFLGSTVVPVVLAANKVPAQTGAVGLSWSGNNASYDVYRAANCATVFAGVFTSTSSNAYTDPTAPASGLTCYNVLAYAPGPSPPPQEASSP